MQKSQIRKFRFTDFSLVRLYFVGWRSFRWRIIYWTLLRGKQTSLYCNENHSLMNVWLLGVVKEPLSESDDTREKDQALPDDIPIGDDSSSGEEECGNAMTEEVKLLTKRLSLMDRQTNGLAGWLTDWLTDWLTGWLAGWLADWLTDWLTDWLADWLTHSLTDWLADWLCNLLCDTWTDLLTDCLTDWWTDWLTVWLPDRTDWLNNDCLMDSRTNGPTNRSSVDHYKQHNLVTYDLKNEFWF